MSTKIDLTQLIYRDIINTYKCITEVYMGDMSLLTPYGCTHEKLARVLVLALEGLTNIEISNVTGVDRNIVAEILAFETLNYDTLVACNLSGDMVLTYETVRDKITAARAKRLSAVEDTAVNITQNILQRMDLMLQTGVEISFKTLAESAKILHTIGTSQTIARQNALTAGAVNQPLEQQAVIRVNIFNNATDQNKAVVDRENRIIAMESKKDRVSLVNMSVEALRDKAGLADSYTRTNSASLTDIMANVLKEPTIVVEDTHDVGLYPHDSIDAIVDDALNKVASS